MADSKSTVKRVDVLRAHKDEAADRASDTGLGASPSRIVERFHEALEGMGIREFLEGVVETSSDSELRAIASKALR